MNTHAPHAALASALLIAAAAGTTGCGSSTGSRDGDVAVGAGSGALLGGLIGGLAGGGEGALIGAGAGAVLGGILGSINFDEFEKRQATDNERFIAQQQSNQAIANAQAQAGTKYDDVDEVWTTVDRNEDTTTLAAIDKNTGQPTGEVIEAPTESVDTIVNESNGVVDASDNVDIPVVGGKTVVITS